MFLFFTVKFPLHIKHKYFTPGTAVPHPINCQIFKPEAPVAFFPIIREGRHGDLGYPDKTAGCAACVWCAW